MFVGPDYAYLMRAKGFEDEAKAEKHISEMVEAVNSMDMMRLVLKSIRCLRK